jgi:hypothetical protein
LTFKPDSRAEVWNKLDEIPIRAMRQAVNDVFDYRSLESALVFWINGAAHGVDDERSINLAATAKCLDDPSIVTLSFVLAFRRL